MVPAALRRPGRRRTGVGHCGLHEGLRVPPDEIEPALERARRAAEILEARLEHEHPALAGEIAVLVDDGAVSGVTLGAACRWARGQEVRRLVAATPVAHVAALARLADEADDVVCPSPLEEIAVVGQAYASFDPLEEWYIAGLLAG